MGPVLSGQNLVPNPGFDELSACPTDFSQIALAAPWFSAWKTPDVYNACSGNDRLTVPQGGIGSNSHYQPQRSGEGYAGIVVYADFTNENILEYIETPLLTAMKGGTPYYIEFYVAPDINPQKSWTYTDAIGLAFTENEYHEEVKPHEAMSLTPAIEHTGTLIRDTMGWTRISGCFNAVGTEKYLVIGNFRNEKETLIDTQDPETYPHVNYFFIEDVLVEAFDPLPDTMIICDGSTKQLNATFHDATYQWNTSETTPSIEVRDEGIYYVEASIGGCVLTDTVRVLHGDKPVHFPEDTVGCSNSTFILQSPLPGKCTWSDGTNSSQLAVHETGNYSVTISNECGQYEFSTNVTLEECDCKIFVPNIFSPNDDGSNDRLEVFANCDFEYQLLSFQIFDRWGNMVYSANADDAISWDGKVHGEKVQSGVYAWRATYQIIRDGKIENRNGSGDLMVVR